MVDVNGTFFHAVLGDDWPALLAGDVDPDGGLVFNEDAGTVGLRDEGLRFPHRPGEELLTPAHRRGAGADTFGNVFWIGDDEKHIRVLFSGAAADGVYWSVDQLAEAEDEDHAGDFTTCSDAAAEAATVRLRGLAVTRSGWLVVGTLEPGGLLAFDLCSGGPPRWLRWPIAFHPFDLAPRGDGLVVLEHPEALAEPRLWNLDRNLRICDPAMPRLLDEVRPDFEPEDGSDPLLPGHEVLFPVPPTLAGLRRDAVVAVAALDDRSLLVLENDTPENGGVRPTSRVHRFRGTEPAGSAEVLAYTADGEGETAVRGHDMVVRGDALLVADSGGNQVFASTISITDGTSEDVLVLDPEPRYLPLRRWPGRALVEPLAAGDDVYYDFDRTNENGETVTRWLPLVEPPRRRYISEATLGGLVFDGKEPGTVWHRLVIDACLGDRGRVTFESRTADELHLLDSVEWFEEPRPVARPGTELPFAEPRLGLFELLFQNARGRFLELRLTVHGDGRSTPRIHALRAWYPRFSYLESYLPAVYGEDAVSSSFLDRFLANVEGIWTALEGHVAEAQVFFDPRTAPPEALEWLAGWLGAMLDPEWDDERRRLFIAHAVELFHWRGTRAGLATAIRLAIDECPGEHVFCELPSFDGTKPAVRDNVRIVEDFKNPHRFTVLVPALPDETAGERQHRRAKITLVVELEKPAHTLFDVEEFWALFQVGSARLGLDTQLGEGSRYTAMVLGAGYVGERFLGAPCCGGAQPRMILGNDPLDGPRL